ncbi:hypothetical protein QBE52_07220 [Clostridiaceae bacterium 35-E11]
MNVLQDIWETNRTIIPKSIRLTLNNWPIIFTGLVYSILLGVLLRVASLFWILGGIIATLIQSAVISNYLYLIENIIRHGKISFEDFKYGFKVYIWKIYVVMIVIWFVNYGASLFLRPILNIGIGPISLWLFLQGAAFILFNCLPEVIYQKDYMVGDSFTYCIDFVKENWIDWFIPNIILVIFLYVMMGKRLLWGSFLGSISFLSLSNGFVFYVIGQILLSFAMVYRGLLFDILSGTSRRKRMFMRNIYK